MPPVHATVYANGVLIGHADLRPLDSTAGTYGGPFHPAEDYAAVRPTVLELMRRSWPRQERTSAGHLREAYRRHDALVLAVHVTGDEVLHPDAVYIEDAGGVWTDPTPRIEVQGLPVAERRRYFDA